MIKFESLTQKCLLIILVIASSNIISPGYCQAQTRVRVLIITGGHEFEREAFFHIFEDIPGLEYQEAIHPNANQLYDSKFTDSIDVLIFYDMVQEIEDAQKTAFIKLLGNGKGLVFLHHSMADYQEWDEFEKIIGGRYVLSNAEENGSSYRHDVDIPVTVVDKNHPITKGMDDFIIHDEVYGNYKVLPSVQPLLQTTHPESGKILGWTNSYAKSRIVTLQLGHDHYAYENPNYRVLIKQAIDWVQAK